MIKNFTWYLMVLLIVFPSYAFCSDKVKFRGEVVSIKSNGSSVLLPKISFRVNAINVIGSVNIDVGKNGAFEQVLSNSLQAGTKVKLEFPPFWNVVEPPNGIMFIPNNVANNSVLIKLSKKRKFTPPKKVVRKNRNMNKNISSNNCKFNLSSKNKYVQVVSLPDMKKALAVENSMKHKYDTCVLKVNIRNQYFHRVIVKLKKGRNSKSVCKDIKKIFSLDCIPI